MAVNLGAAPFQLPVPGVTTLTPQDWTPSPAFRDTVPVLPRRKLGVVIHYPGIVAGNYEHIHNVVEAARAQQSSYRASRGYDLGYNYMVDQGGRAASVRGMYRSAANGTTDANEWYLAIQILVDPDEGLNAFQAVAVQRIIYWLRMQHGYGLAILGHRNVRSTSCPGDQIYAWLKAGGFEPKPDEWPENFFNPWAGRYATLPDVPKPALNGGEGPDNYVVSYLQGVLIHEFSQVITDPQGTYGWSTVSALLNMKRWFNATHPAGMPDMVMDGRVDQYEWNYLDFAVKT